MPQNLKKSPTYLMSITSKQDGIVLWPFQHSGYKSNHMPKCYHFKNVLFELFKAKDFDEPNSFLSTQTFSFSDLNSTTALIINKHFYTLTILHYKS